MKFLITLLQGITFYLLTIPSLVAAEKNKSLGAGQIADNLTESITLFGDFIFTACFVLGISFLFAAVVKYVEHRKSPLMVPIGTVVFLLIAGLLLMLLPFMSYLTDSGLTYSLFQ